VTTTTHKSTFMPTYQDPRFSQSSILKVIHENASRNVKLQALTRGAARELPLSTGYRVLHVEQQVDQAAAILFRRMSPINPGAMYELRVRKEDKAWKLASETAIPWPAAADGNDFPPPRGDQNTPENTAARGFGD
jgi:hypothetical protein